MATEVWRSHQENNGGKDGGWETTTTTKTLGSAAAVTPRRSRGVDADQFHGVSPPSSGASRSKRRERSVTSGAVTSPKPSKKTMIPNADSKEGGDGGDSGRLMAALQTESPSTSPRGISRGDKKVLPRSLQQVFSAARRRVRRQQRGAVMEERKQRYQAFCAVTSLQVFPLQEQAFQYLDQLRVQHGVTPNTKESNAPHLEQQQQPQETLKDEPDDQINQHLGTTEQSLDFLEEQTIPVGILPDHITLLPPNTRSALLETTSAQEGRISHHYSFLPALWSMEPRIFAVDKRDHSGGRKYVVGHLGRFLHHYWVHCDPRARHYYELIREGTPCRLYFDIEFHKLANPDISDTLSQTLLNQFIQELCDHVHSQFQIQIDRTAVVDLDSSTPKKYSRHLIVHLPQGQLFEDTAACGVFARHLFAKLAEERETGILHRRHATLATHLFVHAESATAAKRSVHHPRPMQMVPIVDLGVYTRNRLFRLLGSSKVGKPASAALHIAPENTFPFPCGFANQKFYVPEQERLTPSLSLSATTTTSQEDDTMTFPFASPKDLAEFESLIDWSPHADALEKTLVVPMNQSKIQFPILPRLPQAEENLPKRCASQPPHVSCLPAPPPLPRRDGTGPSPFALLDEYILKGPGSTGGTPGWIRAWSVEYHNNDKNVMSRITYQMARNRWCENIGREHKSNNVMWTVDLDNLHCWQTCHDPDCRMAQFRGTLRPIPEQVAESVRDVLLDMAMATLEAEEETNADESFPPPTELNESFEAALLALNLTPNKQQQQQQRLADPQDRPVNASQSTQGSNEPTDEWDAIFAEAVARHPHLFS